MLAKNLVKKYGKKLIGKTVYTERMGDYPGGIATVLEIYPDKNAPDIVCQVYNENFGEVGIFKYETIILLKEKDNLIKNKETLS